MDLPTVSLPTAVLAVLAACIVTVTSAPVTGSQLTLSVDDTKSMASTTSRFLSVTISGGQMRKGLIGWEFGSKKLENIAEALSPAEIRIGGTYNDFLHFDPTCQQASCGDVASPIYETIEQADTDGLQPNKKMEGLDFIMSAKRWDNITNFCEKVGWDILWDIGALFRPNGDWDSTQARQFLQYSAQKGIKIPMFELGNEPNLYKRKFGLDISAEQLVEDYEALKDLLAEFPEYANSGIYAPGVNNMDVFKSPRKYLKKFLQNGGCDLITEVALHHYNFKSSEVELSDFYSLEIMEQLRDQLNFAYNISLPNCNNKPVPIRFTETSTASGGGQEDVTNAYVAGFLWLDKLGMSATFNVTRVFRQTFLKSSYALVPKNLEPNPDYYLSVLYKRLVEGPVFKVQNPTPLVRVYAHCVSKSYYSYPDGAVVVYYLNIGDASYDLSLSQFGTGDVDVFLLTPEGGDVLSRSVVLNKKQGVDTAPLQMNGNDLPVLDAMSHSGDVPLAPKTYGFIVVPHADVQLCKDYHCTGDSC